MSDEISILIQDRKTGQRRNLTLNVVDISNFEYIHYFFQINITGNIEDLTKDVEKLTEIPSDELEVVFCGKKLSKSTIMRDLSLTPAT